MSKHKKLLYQIECAKANKQRLHLSNGIVLDFTDKDEWQDVYRNSFGHSRDLYGEKGKYYLITRKFPTGNSKMELIKCDGNRLYFPEFTRAVMELDVKPYKER